MSATDTLKTILTLEQNVAVPAKVAAEAVENLGQEASQAERRVDGLGDELTRLGGVAVVAAGAVSTVGAGNQLTQMFGQLAGGIPILNNVASSIAGGPTSILFALEKAHMATMAFAGSFGFLGQAVATIGPILKAALPTVTQGAGLALALPLMDRAAQKDTDQRIFSSIYDSPALGAQMMDYVKSYTLKSAFERSSITEGAKTLSFQRQDVGRYLPVMETLASAGGGTPEAFSRVTDIWRRMMGGQVTEALGSEGLGSLGINRGMLEGVGAKFNKQGTFLGSPEEAAEMLKTLTETDTTLKSIRSNMESSVQAKKSNFFESMNANIDKFAATVSEKAIPLLDQLTNVLLDMAESDVPKMLGETFADVFGFGDDLASTFGNIGAAFAATIDTALKMARNGVQFVTEVMANFDGFLDKTQMALDVASRAPGPVGDFFKGPAAIFGTARTLFKGLWNGAEDAVIGQGENKADFGSAYDKYLKAMEEGKARRQAQGETSAPNPLPALTRQAEAQAEATAHLASINRNTQILAEASIQRMILGGGELGSHGVTPYQVSSMRGRSTGSPVERAVKDLVNAVYEDGARRLQSYDNMIQGRA